MQRRRRKQFESPTLDTLAAQNAATRALMERVTARGQLMLTGAQVGERYLGRVCVLSFRTRHADMETCVQQLGEESARLLAEAASSRASAKSYGASR